MDLNHPQEKVLVRTMAEWMVPLTAWDITFLNINLTEGNQLRLGQLLFQHILKQLPANRLPSQVEEAHIWIDSSDPEILSLPWSLLAHGASFLQAMGWSCSLTTAPPTHQVQLPTVPRILVAMPQPVGRGATQAKAHLEALEYRLIKADPRFSHSLNLRSVETWEGFKKTLIEWQPHLIYYYGAGVGSVPGHAEPGLLFADGKKSTPHPVPLTQWVRALEMLAPEAYPRLVYLNGVQCDPTALLLWGRGLSQHLPAVVVGRSGHKAPANLREQVAMHHASYFWQSLLLKPDHPPHKAVANLPSLPNTEHPSLANGRWSTPILFRHYQNWHSTPPTGQTIADPYWYLKVDRRIQFGPVAEETRQMFLNLRPRSLAYLWYGKEGQGVELFHKRITIQLAHDMKEVYLLEKQARWPDYIPDHADDQWREMILEAFGVESLQEIPGHICRESGSSGGRKVLLHMRHEPLRKGDVVEPRNIPGYISWWDKEITPLLKTGAANAHGLLGISFVVSKPERFNNLLNDIKLRETILDHTIVHVLDELAALGLTDLIQFLQFHNIIIPSQKRIEILKKILQETGGDYELTLTHLRELAARAWPEDQAKKEQANKDGTSSNDDW